MKVLNYFDKAYYINMSFRLDRKDYFEKQINKLGLNVERFEGIELDSINHEDQNRHRKLGCVLSHLKIIEQAKQQNLESVLIFEDDCIFHPKFIEKATVAVNELYNKHWDLLYFGGEPNGICERYTKHLNKATNGIYQTHAYAVHKNFYDSILSMEPDRVHNIDIFYLHSNAISLITRELLCKQRDGYSDNFGQHITFDYKKSYDKYMQ